MLALVLRIYKCWYFKMTRRGAIALLRVFRQTPGSFVDGKAIVTPDTCSDTVGVWPSLELILEMAR